MICIGMTLYFLTEKQNDRIETQILIPTIAKEVRQLQERNHRLQYEIDRFENPIYLMELSRKPEYAHLKYPTTDRIILIHSHEDHQNL